MVGEKGKVISLLSLLRQQEAYIYQVAFYMLNEEKGAIEAAKRTVQAVFAHEDLLQMDEHAQKEFIRKLTIQTSLEVHFKANAHAELVTS